MYTIENEVPIPKANKGARKTDPLLEESLKLLEVNQSLYVPNLDGDHLMPLQHRVICTISKIKKHRKERGEDERTFITRQQGDGIRVWRTA